MITEKMQTVAHIMYGLPEKRDLAKFEYVSEKREHWRIFRAPVEGKVRGDCDDALTYTAGLLTDFEPGAVKSGIKSGVFRCHRIVHKERGTGHIRLEYNGWYICNISKGWTSSDLLPGYRRDKVRTWGQIRRKIWVSWFWDNWPKILFWALCLAIGLWLGF